MNDRTRTALLLTLLLVVGALVALDTLRKNAPADDAPVPDHAQRAERLAQRVALVEQEDDWQRVLDERQQQWSEVRRTSVVAATPELAVADFRALLQDEARALGLSVDTTDRSTSRALDNVPASLERVHELEVRFTLSARDPRLLHRYADAIEHLPDLRAHVAELTLRGPGLSQIMQGDSSANEALQRVRATLTVRALGVTPSIASSTDGGDA